MPTLHCFQKIAKLSHFWLPTLLQKSASINWKGHFHARCPEGVQVFLLCATKWGKSYPKGPCISSVDRITRTSARMLQLFKSSQVMEFGNEVWNSKKQAKSWLLFASPPTQPASWACCDWLHYWQCVVKTNINMLGANLLWQLVKGTKIACNISIALSALHPCLLYHLPVWREMTCLLKSNTSLPLYPDF